MLDIQFTRSQFPALSSDWAFMDNAGGSVPCQQVIEHTRQHMERLPFQLGASYGPSVEAQAAVDAGRRAAAALLGAEVDEVVLGSSSTTLAYRLSAALSSAWQSGDEVIVTNLDHEANIGPWRKLEQMGIVIREWRVREATLTLHKEDLEALLGDRTRLVALTHSSNIVGSILDVPDLCATIRAAGALSCVDGVAYAPHRRVDVRALGADFYFASLYKIYGPHYAMLFGRRELLLEAHNLSHFFVPNDSLPGKFEPGGVSYEAVASLVGITDYMQAFGAHHGLGNDLDLNGCFDIIADYEMRLLQPLLSFLEQHPKVHLLGSPVAEASTRVPTVAFTVEGRRSSEIPPLLDDRRIAIRYGHFYAYRLLQDLNLLEGDGILRTSLVHYNSETEVSKLINALGDLL
ncbi:MAG: cysteine desulfurase family protein (TIGR01976 family) [Candidatus Paceibacteria bacterium]|jgi:cysteine desulfurase family protein (TIGR01976 family)